MGLLTTYFVRISLKLRYGATSSRYAWGSTTCTPPMSSIVISKYTIEIHFAIAREYPHQQQRCCETMWFRVVSRSRNSPIETWYYLWNDRVHGPWGGSLIVRVWSRGRFVVPGDGTFWILEWDPSLRRGERLLLRQMFQDDQIRNQCRSWRLH